MLPLERLKFYHMINCAHMTYIYDPIKSVVAAFDETNEESDVYGRVLFETKDRTELFTDFQCADNKLFLIPGIGRKLLIFDLLEQNLEEIEMDFLDGFDMSHYFVPYLFYVSVYSDSCIYMIGLDYPGIVVYDVNKKEIEVIHVNKEMKHLEYGICWNSVCKKDNILYISVASEPTVLRFDMNTKELEYHNLDCIYDGFNGIAAYEDELYLVGRGKLGGSICKWNDITNEISLINVTENNELFMLREPIIIEDNMYIFSFNSSDVYRINLVTEEVFEMKNLKQIIDQPSGQLIREYVTCIKIVDGNKLAFQSGWDLKWHVYNPTTGDIKERFYHLCYEKAITNTRELYMNELRDAIKNNMGIIMEENMGLNDFLSII